MVMTIIPEFKKFAYKLRPQWYINRKNLRKGNYVRIKKNVKFNTKVVLEDGASVGDRTIFTGKKVTIGKHSNLLGDNELVGPIEIGKYCAIVRGSVFQGVNHVVTRPSMQFSFYKKYNFKLLSHSDKGGITIGNDVWIGTQVIILPGVKIGDGAIIGAGSVVTKDVEPYSLTAGAPAKFKKYRFNEEIREKLLDIKWWDWSEERIQRNKSFFNSDIHNLTKEKIDDLIVP